LISLSKSLNFGSPVTSSAFFFFASAAGAVLAEHGSFVPGELVFTVIYDIRNRLGRASEGDDER
jgi:hypothetical protein